MSKSTEFKNQIKILTKSIQSLKAYYNHKYEKVNKTILLNKRINQKLSNLKSLQNDYITIKSADSKFDVSKKSIENCIYLSLIKTEMESNPHTKEFHIDYTDEIAKALIQVIQTFNTTNTTSTLDLEVLNQSKKEAITVAIESFFPLNYTDILKNVVFFQGSKLFYGLFSEDICWDNARKGFNILLSNNNKTATHDNSTVHNMVLGSKCFSEGLITWNIRVDSKGDTNWLCVGVYESCGSMTYADNQSSQYGLHIRGGEYTCNNMVPERIPNIENNDILSCTLNFEEDSFTIESKDKFIVKSNKSIIGKKWYPSAQLYYANQGVTIVYE